MLEEKIIEWEKQFLRQGRQEGRIEGIREVLLKLLQLKFGPLPPSARRTLEAISRKRELERLAGRILKAKSLAELGLG